MSRSHTFVFAMDQVDLGAGKQAIVIFVPVPQQKAFNKIQQR